MLTVIDVRRKASLRPNVLAALGLYLATSAAAQAPLATPEAAARHFYETLRAHDWTAMAAAMHPGALAKFRDTFGVIVTSPRGGEVRGQFFGGASTDSLAKLNDAQFFAEFLNSTMGRDPTLQSVMDSSQIEILGHIDEAPDLAHVVIRMHLSLAGVSVAKPDVVTFERRGNDWLALLRADIEIMGAALRQRFGT